MADKKGKFANDEHWVPGCRVGETRGFQIGSENDINSLKHFSGKLQKELCTHP